MFKIDNFVNYVKHVNVIQEVVSTETYRDQQIGKETDSGDVIFVKDFIDKIINFLEAFPTSEDYESVGPLGTSPSGGYMKNKNDNLSTIKRKNYKDFLEKEVKVSEIYFDPNEVKTHQYNYMSQGRMDNIERMLNLMLNIKNNNASVTSLRIIFGEDDEIKKKYSKKIKENSLSIEETQILYKKIFNALKADQVFSNLIETRGNNKNVWLISPIKDAIFNTTLRDEISKNSDVKEKIKKEIDDEIDKIEKSLAKARLKTKKEELQKKLEELKKEKEELKEIHTLNFFKAKESLKHVVDLFKSIKTKINKNMTNEFDKAISWRKLIFDYNDLTASGLSNEIIRDRKYVIDFLVGLDFKVNELEFDVGYVTPPEDYPYEKGKAVGTPISFSELIVYLKVKSNEIKPKDEAKLKKMLEELNLKKDEDYNEIIDLKLLVTKRLEGNLLETLKKEDLTKTFGDNTLASMDGKDLFAWAGKNGKTKEMQALVKRYDRNKYSQLLSTIKIFLNRSKEEYLKAIEIIENPRIIKGNSRLKIIFTLSPRAFISQSTRANLRNGITSCMNIFFGCNRRYVPTALASGAFTAYLVRVNKNKDLNEDVVDSKIIDPIARVVVKPFYKKDKPGEIYWYVDRPYVDTASTITDFNIKVKNILNKYHNAFLSDGQYGLNRSNYADSLTSFDVDRYFKIVNDEEMLNAFKMELKQNSPQAIADFDQIIDKQGDNIFLLWGKDDFYPTPMKNMRIKIDIRKLPNGIVCNTLEVKTKTLAKLPDDLECKNLALRSNEGLTSINNLKNIDKIEHLDIYDTKISLPSALLKSKKIKDLSIGDENNIPGDTIEMENATINIDDREDKFPKNITCKELRLVDCENINQIQNLKCQKLHINFANNPTPEDIAFINKLEIDEISISGGKKVMATDCNMDLSKIKKKIIFNLNADETCKVILPTFFDELEVEDTRANFTSSIGIQKLDSLKLLNMVMNLPSSPDFWKNLSNFKINKCYLEFNESLLNCRSIFESIIDQKFDYNCFYYLNHKKLTKKDIDQMLEDRDFTVFEELTISNKMKKEDLSKIEKEHMVTDRLIINLSKNDNINEKLKDKNIFIGSDTIVNINIKDDIKFNFSISFMSKLAAINKKITINVDSTVKKIDISKLFKESKCLITIISESDEDSIYDDLSLKVISNTNFIMKNKKAIKKFIPLSFNEIDKKLKIKISDMANLRFSLEDMKKKFAFSDYFIFDNSNKNLEFNIYLYEVYHDMFKKINIPYKKMLAVKDDEEKTKEFVEKITKKIDSMIDEIDFEITDLDEINKQNRVILDFKNITYNDDKFAKQNNITLEEVQEIKRDIIQKHKINSYLVEKIYNKIIAKIPKSYLENDKRPRIVASKTDASYLPEEE